LCPSLHNYQVGPGIPPPNPASALDAPLVENPYAWTKKSAMLFVEQPGGTGFSTASSAWTGEEAVHRTEDDVAQNFYDFLQNLYEVFGDELRKKKLYISGESYAGFYVPSIARGIYLRNKKVSSDSQLINLAGVAIGNGWIDAYIQVGSDTVNFN
jgi:carboxypeptidase C (cathepsin A)